MQAMERVGLAASRNQPSFSIDPEVALLQMRKHWLEIARPEQIIVDDDSWDTWLGIAGRGWGKTRVGAEDTLWYAGTHPGCRVAVASSTYDDVRFTCYEGESGIISIAPPCLIADYNSSFLQITLWNGSIIRGFSAEKPERMRGPQFHRAWCDEQAAWPDPEYMMDMLGFGVRLPHDPKIVITTTPKPLKIMRDSIKDDVRKGGRTVIVRGSTYDNKDNLAKPFLKKVMKYEGTNLGRQELHGEVLDPEEQGIFKRSSFKKWPADKKLPVFELIVYSLDTAFTEHDVNKKTGDVAYTACTVWGVFNVGLKPLPPGVHDPRCHFGVMMLDAWHEQIGFPELRRRAKKEANQRYGAKDYARRPDVIIVEVKGSGISLEQELREAKLNVIKYNPYKESKLQRAHMVSHVPSHGFVWLPESAVNPGEFRDWCDEWMDEVCTFSPATLGKQPNDFVDSTTQAWRYIDDSGFLNFDPIPEPPDVDYHEQKRSSQNPYTA